MNCITHTAPAAFSETLPLPLAVDAATGLAIQRTAIQQALPVLRALIRIAQNQRVASPVIAQANHALRVLTQALDSEVSA